jgi:hypothetical protein
MALLLKGGGVFLHVPRTGGNWVTTVLKEAGLVQRDIGYHKHLDWHRTADCRQLQSFGTRLLPRCFWRAFGADFTFCFVRHPLSWYESWWRYMSQSKVNWKDFVDDSNPRYWHPNSALAGLGDADFGSFVRNVLSKRPGYVSEMFGWYAHPSIGMVGKQESLREDLVRALHLQNLNFDEQFFMEYPTVGVSQVQEEIVWEDSLRDEALRVEHATIARYGY